MGSFPSSTNAETDAEIFRQLKAKYDEASQNGASDDALFEIMKKAVTDIKISSTAPEAAGVAAIPSSSTDNNGATTETEAAPAERAPPPEAVPAADEISPEELQKQQKELDLEFRIACGAFHKGKAKANLARAQSLLKEGEDSNGSVKVNVNAPDDDGCTPLILACGEGHLNIVEWLTDTAKAAVDAQDNDQCTALWTACFNGKRDIAQHLLLVGADDTIKGKPPNEPISTPALAARRNRHPGLADLLDAERSLRAADSTRLERQRARDMTVEEFRESIRKAGTPGAPTG